MKEMKKIMERQIDYSRNSHELYKDVVMIADLLKAECLNQEEADILCRYASIKHETFVGEDRNLSL